MSDNPNFGFGKFVPGFDFLQNIAKGSSQAAPQMPSLSNWVAPTLNVEELQKRIDELKAVHFWLDQNSKALGATVQALELQKMTLATLKGMNFNMAEVANALMLKAADNPFARAAAQGAGAGAAPAPAAAPEAQEPAPGSAARPPKGDDNDKGEAGSGAEGADQRAGAEQSAGTGLVDPLQWWGALTQQFQEIATAAMRDAGRHPAVEAVTSLSADATQAAMKMVTGAADAAAAPAKRTGGRKSAAKSTTKTAAKSAAKSPARTARKRTSGTR